MVRVDTKGRIVIPSEVREQLGLRPGSEVAVTATSGRAIVEPETDPEQLMYDLEAMIDEATTNASTVERATQRAVTVHSIET